MALGSIWDNYRPTTNNTTSRPKATGDVMQGKQPTQSPQALATGTSSNSGKTAKPDYSSAYSYLASLYANRNNGYQGAYDAALGRLNSAYDSAAQSYGDIYNRGISALDSAYAAQQEKLNNQANNSLREAYINRMLAQKDLPQQLAAMGISGGASETSLNQLINNEGTARANINRGLSDNLADLAANYNNNANNLFSTYQQQMAALESNRANALNSLEMNLAQQNANAEDGYLKLLASNKDLLAAVAKQALANQNDSANSLANAAVNATVANNTPTNNAVDAKQNAVTDALSKYAQKLIADSLASGGNASKTEQALRLRQMGYSNADILAILNS